MNNLFVLDRFKFTVVVIFIIVAFVSFFKLTESPPTWTDEGLIVQTSKNLSLQGIYGFQIAPNELISPSFISTSYTVTYPIALFFDLFGANLLNARIVMGIYILLFFIAVFWISKNWAKEESIWTLLLVATFPPLYGHGKNVLGEIPGLFWLLVSAIFINNLYKNRGSLSNWIFFGITFGFTLVTKPIFILALPGMLYGLWIIHQRQSILNLKNILALLVSVTLPVLIWLLVQFDTGDGLRAIIGYYSNPHSVDIVQSVLINLKDFLTNSRTLFAGSIFIFWTGTLVYSKYLGRKIELMEIYLYTISFFVFVLYFRNPPYYRYFFISEILSLIFLSSNLFKYYSNINWIKYTLRLGLVFLVLFQAYQLGFNSWVADSYNSHRFSSIDSVVSKIPNDTQVFFYQVPEVVISLKHFNYYQYFSGTVSTHFGRQNIRLIKEKDHLLVVTKKDIFLNEPEIFDGYGVIKEFDRYVIASK